MKLVQFDNGYYGIKLWFSFLDREHPLHHKWFFKHHVRRWSMIPTRVEAEAIAKRYRDANMPLKYQFLAKL